MTQLQTRKQYAHSLGLANLGRGRMSAAAHEAIAKAEANGMCFAETKPPKMTRTKPREVAVPKAASDKPKREPVLSEEGLMIEAPRTYGDEAYWTYENAKGKTIKVNGIQVCTHCKHSLFWHRCSEPSAVTADGIQNLTVHLG